MPELACPNCGGAGRIPREKVNTRLVCKKCHMVFHMTSGGRTVLGEPPTETGKGGRHSGRDALAEAKPRADWRENLPEFTVTGKSALVALVLIVVVAIGYFLFNQAPESLQDRGKRVGEAFADGKLNQLKGFASDDSADEVVQWYGIADRVLQERKKLWSGAEVRVGVVPVDENLRAKTGEVLVSLVPTHAPPHAESITKHTDQAELARRSLELTLHFKLDAWGKWRLDGKKTLLAAPRVGL